MGTLFRTLSFAIAGIIAVGSMLTGPRKSARANAHLLTGAQVPPQVLATFQRSCRDCHTEATEYPWYSYVFPVSWLITDDVVRGRQHLNLSRWNEYSVVRRERCLSEIANQVQDGGMPLPKYLLMHPTARMSRADIEAVFNWTQTERARLIAETVAR